MAETARHIILGTAGHVDHGKTSLVRALTGIDCDTHKEEKQRGITMNLGFTHLSLPNGASIGIVDVPGHADFIHTMVGGASGIDVMMLVIAADSGIMPQTREHLQIMQALGVQKGLVALTKTDLLDPEMLELMRLEVMEFTAGTFLEAAPVMAVSAKTGAGLEALKSVIEHVGTEVEERAIDGPFRMFVDRIFTVSGHGTVVTGSVIGGALKVEDTVRMLPGFDHRPLRVRGLQRHGRSVDNVRAGDRASLNLVGLDRADFQRGMLISDRPLQETVLIDAQIQLFQDHGQQLKRRSQVILHAGTRESIATVNLLDCDTLNEGELALVQIALPVPFVLRAEDRFIIRNSSDTHTLGGGRVLDTTPLHHRKRTKKLLKIITPLAEAGLVERLAHEIRKAYRALTLTDLAQRMNYSEAEVAPQLSGKLAKDILVTQGRHEPVFCTREHEENHRKQIMNALAKFRLAQPLMTQGISYDELRTAIKAPVGDAEDEVIKALLAKLVGKEKIKEKDKTYFLAGDSLEIGQKTADALDALKRYFVETGLRVPLESEMRALARQFGLSDKELRQLLAHLVRIKTIYRIEDDYLYAPLVDTARQKVIEFLTQTPEGMTVAQFRDLIDANRKLCLLLFTLFDQEKTTRRVGDVRLLARLTIT